MMGWRVPIFYSQGRSETVPSEKTEPMIGLTDCFPYLRDLVLNSDRMLRNAPNMLGVILEIK
jgi:hypothetical protein